LVPAL